MSVSKFATYCGMTCLGGSERRECRCKGPSACEMQDHPNFEEEKRKALHRLARVAFNGEEELHKAFDQYIDNKLRGGS